MKRINHIAIVSLGLLIAIVWGTAGSKAVAAIEPGIEGVWLGTLSVNEQLSLRVAFEISRNSDGQLVATFASVDQGAFGIPVEKVTSANGKVTLDVKAIGAVVTGEIKGQTIASSFRQGDREPTPVLLKKIDKMPESPLKRPQEPKKPYPYIEEEVSYENKQDGVTLAGTLTFPKTGGPFPAVVLITGSGPNDRDETIWKHRVFLVLADYLTRQGIAVLRSDDRGVGKSTGDFKTASIADFARDALAGVTYLEARSEINGGRIGVLGHSLGGDIAPLAAAESENVAFAVLMAGSATTLAEDIHYQCRRMFGLGGASEEAIALNERINRSVFGIIEAEEDREVAEKKIRKVLAELTLEAESIDEEDRKIVGMPVPLDVKGFEGFLTANGRFDLFYSAGPSLKKLNCPILALIGEKDAHISPEVNVESIRMALETVGNRTYKVEVLPGLNHLFQTAKTGAPSEYVKIEETIAPSALKLMADWINDVTATARR
jgi:dienelactone hydrolase